MNHSPCDPIVKLSNLSKEYRMPSGVFKAHQIIRAVNNVSLEIARGEIFGLVGESGCGKSTLVKLLAGLEEPTKGETYIGGTTIGKLDRLERARLLQVIFQDPYSSLNPRQTILTALSVPLIVHSIGDATSRRRRITDLMEIVGLSRELLESYPEQLSGGQRQRVAIARALILEPKMLVCDEPTSALDVSVQAQILNLLQQLNRQFDLAILLISHNLAVVQHMAQRIAVMYFGRIVERGQSAAVFRAPHHPYTRALLGSALNPAKPRALLDVEIRGEFPDPLNPPSGCAFHPRCIKCQPLCETEPPKICRDGDDRLVSCHYPG